MSATPSKARSYWRTGAPSEAGGISIFTRPLVAFSTSAIHGRIASTSWLCIGGSQLLYLRVVWAFALSPVPANAAAATINDIQRHWDMAFPPPMNRLFIRQILIVLAACLGGSGPGGRIVMDYIGSCSAVHPDVSPGRTDLSVRRVRDQVGQLLQPTLENARENALDRLKRC